MITEFSNHKQPYEVCFLGQVSSSSGQLDLKISDNLVIISVPSAFHSHKPPLDNLIQLIFEEKEDFEWDRMKKLEVFGRSLLPGWKTIGNQPCLFNMKMK